MNRFEPIFVYRWSLLRFYGLIFEIFACFLQLLGCGVAIFQDEKQALAGILFYGVAVTTS